MKPERIKKGFAGDVIAAGTSPGDVIAAGTWPPPLEYVENLFRFAENMKTFSFSFKAVLAIRASTMAWSLLIMYSILQSQTGSGPERYSLVW